MSIIGITGNICTGKSTIASILSREGANVLSYDSFLYEAYTDQRCQGDIENAFGSNILVNGRIDRTLLKTYLKKNPEDCKKLWNITDEYVDPRIENFFQENQGFSFFECAPLYEKSWDESCELVIASYTPNELRIERLMKRARERDNFHLSRDEAMAVIEQQTISQEEKIKRANYIIWNDGDLDNLEQQTLAIYNEIISRK